MRQCFLPKLGAWLGLVMLMPALTHADSTPLSAQAILQKCEQAYDALPNYQCHTDVTSHGMDVAAFHASADIVFLRPGMVKAEGTDTFGGQYAYTCDGTNTYQLQLGSWKKAQNAEMAIAAVTGTAQDAATTIPALLLHTQWGYPFGPALQISPTVATQNVNGHSCYFITANSSAMKADTILKYAFWVDKKTFLLDQVATNITLGKRHLKTLQVITDTHTNTPITTAAFAAPTGQ